MNISVGPKLEAYIRKKMRNGKYGSASKVVSEGLLLLQERERRQRQLHAALKKDIAAGIDEANAGRVEPLDMAAIKSGARRRWKNRAKNRG